MRALLSCLAAYLRHSSSWHQDFPLDSPHSPASSLELFLPSRPQPSPRPWGQAGLGKKPPSDLKVPGSLGQRLRDFLLPQQLSRHTIHPERSFSKLQAELLAMVCDTCRYSLRAPGYLMYLFESSGAVSVVLVYYILKYIK